MKAFLKDFWRADLWVKGSALIMGLGLIRRGQIIKGLMYLASECLFLLFFFGFGYQYLSKFLTLGENAQKRVEANNFDIRKNVLRYDDVMNKQREIIYNQRNQVLEEVDLKDKILGMLDETIEVAVDSYCPSGADKADWNIAGLKEKFLGWILTENDLTGNETKEELIDLLTTRGHENYENREKEFSSEITRDLERMILLKNVDTLWMDHIDAMEELKKGIGLRAYAQKDPVVMFKFESFDIFDEMTASIRENTVRQMLTVIIRSAEETKREQEAKITATSAGGSSDGSEKGRTVRNKATKVGPNDKCPCGSGKKYKNCCGDVRKTN